MSDLREELFEAVVEITASAVEHADISIDAVGGEKTAEFFSVIYQKLADFLEAEEPCEKDEDNDESEDEEGQADDESEDEESQAESVCESTDEDKIESTDSENTAEPLGEADIIQETEQPAEGELLNNGKPQRLPKFEIYKDKKGEYRFRLKAANGEVIAVSEGYKNKPACIRGIESIKNNASIAVVKEICNE